jgi:nicotinamide-nucleotide amidase
MKATILTIGDEIVIGQVLNTNAAFIAGELNGIGIRIESVVTVGDQEEDILRALSEHQNRADVLIATGGLGPTHDDVTRSAVCRFLGVQLVRSEQARENVRRFLAERNAPWTPSAENQTLIPRGAQVIPNTYGTAPGELFRREGGPCLIVMPGVPYEMEHMMREFVVPELRKEIRGDVILHRTLRTTGIAESMLSEKLGNILDLLEGEKLAFLPAPTGVRLRITVTGTDAAASEEKLHRIEERIRARAGEFIYGTGTEELEEVVGRLLMERSLTIGLAESCTGGMIANKLTNVPGSSLYFERAAVAYSNRSKEELLGVPGELIRAHGAVSREVAEAMARGIRMGAGVAIGCSTTGIAGPSGGTPEKPVGLVWIGYSDERGTSARRFTFGGGRLRIKERAAQAALEVIRRSILEKG